MCMHVGGEQQPYSPTTVGHRSTGSAAKCGYGVTHLADINLTAALYNAISFHAVLCHAVPTAGCAL
jgi:hypothetical protein